MSEWIDKRNRQIRVLRGVATRHSGDQLEAIQWAISRLDGLPEDWVIEEFSWLAAAHELLAVARECLPDPDYLPEEEAEIRVRAIRSRIDDFLARYAVQAVHSQPNSEPHKSEA